MEKALKKKLLAWVEKVGRDRAMDQLMGQGISLSAAQKLVCKSGYQYDPTGIMLAAIERAME